MYQPDMIVVDSTPVNQRVRTLNLAYLKTISCILKILIIVSVYDFWCCWFKKFIRTNYKISLICGTFSASFRYGYWFETKYYNFVSITGILYQALAICLNFFSVTDRFNKIPWNWIVSGLYITLTYLESF
jgi:hypothetical protein